MIAVWIVPQQFHRNRRGVQWCVAQDLNNSVSLSVTVRHRCSLTTKITAVTRRCFDCSSDSSAMFKSVFLLISEMAVSNVSLKFQLLERVLILGYSFLALPAKIRRASCANIRCLPLGPTNRFLAHRKSRQFRGDPKNLTDPCPLRCQRLCIARTVKERQVLFPHPNVKFRRHGKNIVK